MQSWILYVKTGPTVKLQLSCLLNVTLKLSNKINTQTYKQINLQENSQLFSYSERLPALLSNYHNNVNSSQLDSEMETSIITYYDKMDEHMKRAVHNLEKLTPFWAVLIVQLQSSVTMIDLFIPIFLSTVQVTVY
jgi:hypothetical protein